MLSQEQVARYREDGYLLIENVFNAEEVEALREASRTAAMREELKQRNAERTIVHLHPLTIKHAAFKALAADARITERLAPLLGPDVQLQQSKLATKPPAKGEGAFAWHQDLAFFPHTNTDLLAATVFLDEVNEDNGCVKVVKGSHKLGMLDHGNGGMDFQGRCDVTEYLRDQSRLVPMNGPPGSITLHHALLLHGSDGNRSGRPRRLAIFQYRADDAYQLDGRIFPDTGWVVRGRARGFVRCDAGRIPLYGRDFNDKPFGRAWQQVGPSAEEWNRETAQPAEAQPAAAM